MDQTLIETKPIDLFVARRLLAQIGINTSDLKVEEEVALPNANLSSYRNIARMMAHYREGHLCIKGDFFLPNQLCMAVNNQEQMPLKPICSFKGNYYFQKNWVVETRFLMHLIRIARAKPKRELLDDVMVLKATVSLHSEQQKAIERALKASLSLISGGPGTGKTFTAKHLVQQYLDKIPPEQRSSIRVVLTAPTGKAVSHLQKQILCALEGICLENVITGTLHALLQLRSNGITNKNVVLFADLILVDECSMIDAHVFGALLAAIPSGAQLVLIGDPGQLPSVDVGSFFADLIEFSENKLKLGNNDIKEQSMPLTIDSSNCLGIFPLTQLQRPCRIDCSELIQLSHSIKEGNIEKTIEYIAPYLDELPLIDQLGACVQHHFLSSFKTPPGKSHSPDDLALVNLLMRSMGKFRILSCLRQGPLGVDAINHYLMHYFQSRLPREGWWVVPILITRNDYRSQLYNGDMGILVKKINCDQSYHKIGIDDYAIFSGKDPLPGLALPSFEYAYCLSVHKSQGSEYDDVLLIVPEGSERFGKEILYTAVTRCRHSLKIHGKKETIKKMVENSSRKQSGVPLRLGCWE